VVESKNAERRERAPQRLNPLRCPACHMIQDCTLRDFRCTLARFPQKFVKIQPPVGPQPAADKHV
jgi:hypothetical protein